MSVMIDSSAFVAWEKGTFDLPEWLATRPADEPLAFPATVWQELVFGKLAWEPARAAKRSRFLRDVSHMAVSDFGQAQAERAAQLAATLKLQSIGIADFQITASALEENAELLTLNTRHFGRVLGLKLAKV